MTEVSAETCRTCGACCVATEDQETFADLDMDDLQRLSKSVVRLHVLWTPTHLHGTRTRWERTAAGPLTGIELCRCTALRGSPMHRTSCQIYTTRPRVCREAVVPGGKTCLACREELTRLASPSAS